MDNTATICNVALSVTLPLQVLGSTAKREGTLVALSALWRRSARYRACGPVSSVRRGNRGSATTAEPGGVCGARLQRTAAIQRSHGVHSGPGCQPHCRRDPQRRVRCVVAAQLLPGKKPWTEAEALRLGLDLAGGQVNRLDEWRLRPGPYWLGNGIALLLVIGGVSSVVHGATHRPLAREFCRRCGVDVLAYRQRRGLRCPNGDHFARRNLGALIAEVVVFLVGVTFIVTVVVRSLSP